MARTLNRLDVPATFFMLTEIAAFYPDIGREIGQRGHEFTLHGIHHVDNIRPTPPDSVTWSAADATAWPH